MISEKDETYNTPEAAPSSHPFRWLSLEHWRQKSNSSHSQATYLPLSSTSASTSPRPSSVPTRPHSRTWVTLLLASLALLLLFFLWISPYSPTPPPLHKPTCLPADWSAGSWILKTPLPDPTANVLEISGFTGCSSVFAHDWHLGMDSNKTIGEYRRKASDWTWLPGEACRGKTEFVAEELVKSLVEKGGWMMIGDSLTEEQFFSLSCLLHSHVIALPDSKGFSVTKDRLAEAQYLYLAPHSPLISSLTFPLGFDITATPLVKFKRVDLLFDREELSSLHSTLPPFPSSSHHQPSASNSTPFGSEAFWGVPSSSYLTEFSSPFPLNYRVLLVSTAGHWTTATFAFAGGIDEVLYFFQAAVNKWIGLVGKTLDFAEKHRRKDVTDPSYGVEKEVIVRAYLGGHVNCFASSRPWEEVQDYTEKLFNWPWIYKFNDIFRKTIAKSSHRITFLDIIRPAQLRPDSHTYWDCLHHAIGSGVIEGWSDYIHYFLSS